MAKQLEGSQARHIMDWDQDHGMFIGQGTHAGIWQSIMMRPANVAPVYPIFTKTNKLILPDFIAKFDSVVIFNAEANRKDDIMYQAVS